MTALDLPEQRASKTNKRQDDIGELLPQTCEGDNTITSLIYLITKGIFYKPDVFDISRHGTEKSFWIRKEEIVWGGVEGLMGKHLHITLKVKDSLTDLQGPNLFTARAEELTHWKRKRCFSTEVKPRRAHRPEDTHKHTHARRSYLFFHKATVSNRQSGGLLRNPQLWGPPAFHSAAPFPPLQMILPTWA